jgi:signal transduction histidine kinase
VRRHRSLLSRLLVAFSVFAVLIAVAVVVGYLAAARQDRVINRLTGHYQVLQEADGKMGEAFTTAQFAVLSYALTREPGFLRPLAGARAKYEHRLATLRARASPDLRGLVTVQARAGAAWFALAPQITAVPPGTPRARVLLGRSTALTVTFFQSGSRLQLRMARQIERFTRTSNRALTAGLAWSAAAVGVAMLLVLAGSLSTLGTITRPLRGLTATVRRLTAGDRSARAVVTGSAEVREVAQAVNTQADEAARLRAREAESTRLRAMARDGGLRIREHLAAADVIREARSVLEESVDADVIRLMLVTDGRIEAPAGREEDWLREHAADGALPAGSLARLRDLFRTRSSELVQDVAGPGGEELPPWVRDSLRSEGVSRHLLTPFGVGEEMLGFVVAARMGQRRGWSAAEVDAVESIAADIGRGLHHARLYEAENRLVADLKSLDQAKSDFFATVSHELRAPLTSIEGYVEMLTEAEGGPVTAEQRRMLAAVDHGAVRLRTLIDDVFTLSKLESGAFATVMRPVEMTGVISAAVEELEPSVAAAGLSVAQDVPAAGLVVAGDAGQLGRVLVNLLSNAVKFTPRGGRIGVGAVARGNLAVVTVTDTGIGIPEADQEKLFSRFFRAANARRAIPGSGLGLTIVHTIIANHGGQIAIASREGDGTTVTIELPLAARSGPA